MRDLTKNQRAVLNSLTISGRALTAYDILDDVRDVGIRAPVQVYRALEALTARGIVPTATTRRTAPAPSRTMPPSRLRSATTAAWSRKFPPPKSKNH